MFQRRGFTPDQERRESGGRQHDDQGRPLVGRYRDGTTPPPDQQAFGVAQMQIRTARSVARSHNIPWDENRFLNEASYNRRLGDLHMNDLETRYGDRRIAEAAYHSGEPNVDRAIRAHGRTNFWRGLGPEGQRYIGASSGGSTPAPASTPARPAAAPPQATPAERTAMAQDRDWEVTDPFTVGERLGEQHQEVVRRAEAADAVLGSVIEDMEAIQPIREEALRTAVAQKTAVNDEIQSETQQLIDQARPIFQRRQAIAARQTELAEMNPLERMIRGTFSLAHNRSYLEEQDQAYAGVLQSMGQNYQMLTGLQDRLISTIEANYESSDSVWQLTMANLDQDTRLANAGYSSAAQVMGAEMQGLESQVELMGAQQRARIETLTSLSPGQINAALADARGHGGVTTVNGVPLHAGELEVAANQWQEQQLALESRQLALDAQRADLAAGQERRLIDHMTLPQIEAAIANNGTYQGQQLSQSALTAALGAHRDRAAIAVEGVGQTAAPRTARDMLATINNVSRGSSARMLQMFGALPQEQAQYLGRLQTSLNGFAAAVNDANQRGVGQQFITQQMPVLQAMIAEQQAITERVVTRWAGGNRDLAAVGTAWLTGQPIAGESAIRGIISLARNGLPTGTRITGPSAEVFRQVQRIVQQSDTVGAGTDVATMMTGGTTQNREQRERTMIQQIQRVVAGSYSNHTMDSALRATPELARQVRGSNGQPHSFSRVRPEDFRAALQAGDAEGYRRIGNDLGINPNEARSLFNGGTGTPIWAQVRQDRNLTDAQLTQMGRTLQAYQTQAMLQVLDQSPSATDTFRPSRAFASLLQNPQYQNYVGERARLQAQSTFGDFLFGNIAGSGFQEGFYQYSRGVGVAFNTLHAAQLAARAEGIQNMQGGDAFRRTAMVLAGIESLSQADEQHLMNAVRRLVGPSRNAGDFGGRGAGGMAAGDNDQRFERIRGVIMNQRFDDPGLERIRQRAATDWAAMEAAVTRIQRAAQ